MKYPEVSYKLNNKEKEFNKIKDCLYNQGNCEIYEMIRYILNKTNIVSKDNWNKIQDVDNLHNETLGEDYEDQYKEYTKKYLM